MRAVKGCSSIFNILDIQLVTRVTHWRFLSSDGGLLIEFWQRLEAGLSVLIPGGSNSRQQVQFIVVIQISSYIAINDRFLMFFISPFFSFQQIIPFSVKYIFQLHGIFSAWSTATEMREHIWPAWFLQVSGWTYHAESVFFGHLPNLYQYQNV